MHIEQSVLTNGLKVIQVDTGSFPSCTALLLVGTGSRFENTKNNGIAHFFEHMAFKGSKRYPSSLRMTSTIEALGGVFNAFTGKEYTGYWIKAPLSHIATVVDVIADMIQHPLLVSQEIEREKGVIIEEINMYEDTPQDKVGDVYESLLYKNNPLGYDTIGTKQSVGSATRDTFLEFISSYYKPNNAVLVVAGGLQKAEQKPNQKSIPLLAKEQFESWTQGKTASYIPVDVHSMQTRARHEWMRKRSEQAHLVLGYPALNRYDPRRYSLSVLAALLGGGMSSRLFHELRERRGLCYYIGTSHELYHDAGSLYTRAGVPTDPKKIQEAIRVIREEHYQMRDKGPKKVELNRAKELIKGHLLLSLEDSFDTAYFVGKQALFETKMHTPQEILEKIDAVTASDVIIIAKEVIQMQKENIAFIGPSSIRWED